MSTQELTSKQYLLMLRILHLALLAGLVVFLVIAAWLVEERQSGYAEKELEQVLLIVIPIAVFGTFTAGQVVSKNSLKGVRAKAGLNEKLAGYQGVFILNLSFLEMAGMLSTIGFLFTGHYLFAGLTIISALMLAVKRPTPGSICNDLELDPKERSILENPEAFVGEFEKK